MRRSSIITLLALTFFSINNQLNADFFGRCRARYLIASGLTHETKTAEEWKAIYQQARATNDSEQGSYALLNLLLLQAEELNTSTEQKRAIRAFLRYQNDPSTIRQLGDQDFKGASFLSSLLMLDEVRGKTNALGGETDPKYRRARLLHKLAVDLLWTQFPFVFRAAPYKEPASYKIAKSFSPADFKELAEALGLEGDPFLKTVSDYLLHYRLDNKSKKGPRFAAAFRSTILAFALMAGGIHPGAVLTDTVLPSDEDLRKELDEVLREAHTLPSKKFVQGAEEHAGFTAKDKDVVLLVYEPVWKQLWNGSEDFFRNKSGFGGLTQDAKSFRVIKFDSKESLAEELNKISDVDVLILAIHGDSGAMEKRGTFSIDETDIRNFMDKVKEVPIRPNGFIIPIICGFSDIGPNNPVGAEEPWIKLANKKLSPEGGTAVAASANITWISDGGVSLRALRNFGKTFSWGIAGPVGYSYVKKDAGGDGKHFVKKMMEERNQVLPVGIRVYDKRSGKVKFYQDVWDSKTPFREITDPTEEKK